jgi:hypothetical protein
VGERCSLRSKADRVLLRTKFATIGRSKDEAADFSPPIDLGIFFGNIPRQPLQKARARSIMEEAGLSTGRSAPKNIPLRAEYGMTEEAGYVGKASIPVLITVVAASTMVGELNISYVY